MSARHYATVESVAARDALDFHRATHVTLIHNPPLHAWLVDHETARISTPPETAGPGVGDRWPSTPVADLPGWLVLLVVAAVCGLVVLAAVTR